MLQRIKNHFGTALQLLGARFGERRINSVELLCLFGSENAAFVAQTSLFGYLKTRMGTRYRDFFEDDEFSGVIRSSAVKLAVVCLEDLTIFSIAETARQSGMTVDQCRAMAVHCYTEGLARILSDGDREHVTGATENGFVSRISLLDWSAAAVAENAFTRSPKALVKFAPVIDEFKELDSETVINSIRFRWLERRERLRRRLDANLVARDWAERFEKSEQYDASTGKL